MKKRELISCSNNGDQISLPVARGSLENDEFYRLLKEHRRLGTFGVQIISDESSLSVSKTERKRFCGGSFGKCPMEA